MKQKNGTASLRRSESMDIEEETRYTLEHSMKGIRQAEKEIARGEFVTLEEIRADLAKRLKKKNAR